MSKKKTPSPDTIPQNPFMEGMPFPETVGVLPCDDPILFPHMIAPMLVREPRQIRAVERALKSDRLITLYPLRDVQNDDDAGSEKKRLHKVGTLCAVLRVLRIPDGTMRLLVHGLARTTTQEIIKQRPLVIIKPGKAKEIEYERKDMQVEALRKKTLEVLHKAIQLASLTEDLALAAHNIEDPGKLADLIASNFAMTQHQIVQIHQELDTKERLRLIFDMMTREVNLLEIGNQISDRVRDNVDQNQREFFLREQIRVMQTELGESDPLESELQELRSRLEIKDLPDHARKIADKELGRLSMLQPAAAEYGVIRTYIEHILDVPFRERSDDHINLATAAKILDEDHYGLEKVKERILEFLSVIRLKGGALKGPILCLVGPPGVGKTSLGKSVARATGREFSRFSLGGMRDEAEIRGHRRTYIGAMPGRIVKTLIECETVNPLIMLDEIDKIGSDFRGDPSSALLEVLDPEQNDTFGDHYMDMPIDLSHVMFITTANSLDTIPGPLRDRMEIIRLSGYTPFEKEEIAKRYLVKRETSNAGLTQKQIRFTATGLRKLIADYTAEAGVRTLQKQIASVCRKVARKIAEEQSLQELSGRKKVTSKKVTTVSITPEKVEELLGPPLIQMDLAEQNQIPGVSTGLAWTSVGGDILFIEATRFPGKGNLRLTGQLGDVMKESATAALSFLRANRDLLQIEDTEFSEFDFHVHVPAGGIPKDGPSAGVAMISALASLMNDEALRDYIAMTGEISLRGNVLPVGGIKEKVLAAHRSGIKEVLLPSKNHRDLDDIPESVKKKMTFHLIDRIEEAFELVFPSRFKSRKKKSTPQKPTSSVEKPKTQKKKTNVPKPGKGTGVRVKKLNSSSKS